MFLQKVFYPSYRKPAWIAKFLFGFLLFIIPLTLYAKSYTLDRVFIQAEIMTSGNLKIEETRTYKFRGRFSWADYQLPLNKLGTVQNFELWEGNQPYQESNREIPGYYTTRTADNEFYVRWFYRAKNETRSFTLRYILTDAITVYTDVAEFYYKFVGESNLKKISTVDVTIRLPHHATQGEVRAWAHGPLWGTILLQTGILKMNVSPLPANTFWEARVTFPPSWVPGSQRRIDSPKLETILKEEALWAEQANEQRHRAQEQLLRKEEKKSRAKLIAWILSAFGIIAVALFYFKSGRGFQVPYDQKVDPNLPKQPPAIFSTLYYDKQVTGNAMVATLFDLARQGFITIEQKEPAEKKWWRSNKPRFLMKFNHEKWNQEGEQLTEYERSLLDFIFNDLGKGQDTVDFRDFRKHSGKVRKWFQRWKKLLKEEVKDVVLRDKESVKATVYSVIIAVLVTAGGVWTAIYVAEVGIVATVVGAICVALSFVILRYTPEMKLKKKKWKALRNYLTKYHFANRSDQGWLSQIQDYLIYAVAMGAGNKAIQKLMEMVPSDKQQICFAWYVPVAGSQTSAADFAGAVTSMVSMAITTMSSSAGVGGGASAGGGGGAGGASGGAG